MTKFATLYHRGATANMPPRLTCLRGFHRNMVQDMKPLDAVEHLLSLLEWVMEPVRADEAPVEWQGCVLTPMESAVFRLLAARANAFVSHERIYRLWELRGAELDAPQSNIVPVYIAKLRARLRGSNVSIQTAWGRAYRIIAPPGQVWPWDGGAS